MNDAKGFPALFQNKNGKIKITFRDIPEAVIEADDEIDAQVQAVHVLTICREHYAEMNFMWPKPSQTQPGEVYVSF